MFKILIDYVCTLSPKDIDNKLFLFLLWWMWEFFPANIYTFKFFKNIVNSGAYVINVPINLEILSAFSTPVFQIQILSKILMINTK